MLKLYTVSENMSHKCSIKKKEKKCKLFSGCAKLERETDGSK